MVLNGSVKGNNDLSCPSFCLIYRGTTYRFPIPEYSRIFLRGQGIVAEGILDVDGVPSETVQQNTMRITCHLSCLIGDSGGSEGGGYKFVR